MRVPNPSDPDPPTLWGLVALIVVSLVVAAVVLLVTSQ